ncbi:thiamine-phosphate kinase [Filomicrobium sp.]|uniref:thiamine-phosphate kinase n=1 Tax=Filomicrobium sp. TaxID=2024831 RepID=UPI00258C595F|nr:thiamine-phosphate kinase [Filomicrobium sp.]MCV0369728.1 thiamine-phosphate kinase [Filomicrobium sp.]
MAELSKSDAEQAMIARVFAPLTAGLPGALGLTDDAAILSAPSGRQLVLTMDTLVQGVHFLFDGSVQQASDAAYKALAVNVSDLVAKAADPLAYMLSLTLPAVGSTDWLEGLAEGFRQGQSDWSIHLAGGDTVRGTSGLALTVTAIGSVPQETAVLRRNARPGDRLIVTGTIGDAWAGLHVCQSSEAFAHLSRTDADFLKNRYQRPRPKLGIVEALRTYASAAMDISDGLILDLERMCRASGVGACLRAPQVPLSAPIQQLVNNQKVSLTDALSGGDDYEILAAVPPDALGAFAEAARHAGVSIAEVGEIIATLGVSVVGDDGNSLSITRKGWDHLG